MTLAFPDRMVSQAISRDSESGWRAVALCQLEIDISFEWQQMKCNAPTGILIGPLEGMSSKFTQPAGVLINL